jgi:uncharacterized paraquat-inducible protein A
MSRQTLQCDKCMKRYEADVPVTRDTSKVPCPRCKKPLRKVWDRAPYGVVK